MPTINGTGTEDYYNGAWDFGGQPFANLHQGAPYIVDPERIGGRYCLYRWHTESPIAFEKSIKVTIEHGTRQRPLRRFLFDGLLVPDGAACGVSALPAAADRVPRVFDPGGGAAPAPVPAG